MSQKCQSEKDKKNNTFQVFKKLVLKEQADVILVKIL